MVLPTTKQPKVSIIIPSFNCANYLTEALDSVLAQTISEWECIIVDDGSSDNTRQIVQTYCDKDNRFSYIYQKNQGPSAARNTGIEQTSAPYILPLDADDRLAPSYVEKASTYLEQHPETTLVYGLVEFFGNRNGIWALPPYKYDNFIWSNSIVSSAMYRRTDFLETTGYNSNMKHGFEDWDFWLTFLTPESIVHRIDEVMYYYRMTSMTRSADASAHSDELLRTIYNNHPEVYKPYVSDIISLHRLQNIQQSHAYRLGRFLLKPYKFMKRKLS